MSAAVALGQAIKFVVRLSANQQVLSFNKPVVTVGRGPENDIVLHDPKVSRVHFEIRTENGSLIVRNLSQKNFLLVNGLDVSVQKIENEALIHVGESELRIQLESMVGMLQASPLRALTPGDGAGDPSEVTMAIQPLAGAAAPAQVRSQPLQQPSAYSRPRPASTSRRQNPVRSRSGQPDRSKFYAIIFIVGLLVFWLISSDPLGKKQTTEIRSQIDIQKSIEESASAVQEIQKEQKKEGKGTLQYQMAQQHYVKGFRDYKQGQYARAMQSFQAALSFYPAHELARKYWTLAKRKFDELVQFNMIQGRKYFGKNHFRLCRASFANVMIMVKDPNDIVYKEAKQKYDECSLRLEGGY